MLALILIAAAVETRDACQPMVADGWRAACLAVIERTPDPKERAKLQFHRAFADNERNDYQDGREALQAAVKLDPTLPAVWHELGYTENSLGNFADAEAALAHELALNPDSADGYQERIFARLRRAEFVDLLADADRLVALRPDSAPARLERARGAMWLGRFDDARRDLDGAAQRAASDKERGQVAEARKTLALWTARSSSDPTAACAAAMSAGHVGDAATIGDCTAAFLAATSATARADHLTTRATAWLVAARDEGAAILDQQIVVALNPDSMPAHVNLAFGFLQGHHSWAARQEFDRALGLQTSGTKAQHVAITLAGRASARYNLRDFDGAFADAKQSFEREPNELALTVLGDLAKDRGDSKSAKLYWMGDYHLGDRDDGLVARLKMIGINEPDKEPK